eukprot:jgi/Mesvir1/27750/Mv07440-RA.1
MAEPPSQRPPSPESAPGQTEVQSEAGEAEAKPSWPQVPLFASPTMVPTFPSTLPPSAYFPASNTKVPGGDEVTALRPPLPMTSSMMAHLQACAGPFTAQHGGPMGAGNAARSLLTLKQREILHTQMLGYSYLLMGASVPSHLLQVLLAQSASPPSAADASKDGNGDGTDASTKESSKGVVKPTRPGTESSSITSADVPEGTKDGEADADAGDCPAQVSAPESKDAPGGTLPALPAPSLLPDSLGYAPFLTGSGYTHALHDLALRRDPWMLAAAHPGALYPMYSQFYGVHPFFGVAPPGARESVSTGKGSGGGDSGPTQPGSESEGADRNGVKPEGGSQRGEGDKPAGEDKQREGRRRVKSTRSPRSPERGGGGTRQGGGRGGGRDTDGNGEESPDDSGRRHGGEDNNGNNPAALAAGLDGKSGSVARRNGSGGEPNSGASWSTGGGGVGGESSHRSASSGGRGRDEGGRGGSGRKSRDGRKRERLRSRSRSQSRSGSKDQGRSRSRSRSRSPPAREGAKERGRGDSHRQRRRERERERERRGRDGGGGEKRGRRSDRDRHSRGSSDGDSSGDDYSDRSDREGGDASPGRPVKRERRSPRRDAAGDDAGVGNENGGKNATGGGGGAANTNKLDQPSNKAAGPMGAGLLGPIGVDLKCRRTDGRKWRCSQEALIGQKYCAAHIHRGRHRVRKENSTAALAMSADGHLVDLISMLHGGRGAGAVAAAMHGASLGGKGGPLGGRSAADYLLLPGSASLLGGGGGLDAAAAAAAGGLSPHHPLNMLNHHHAAAAAAAAGGGFKPGGLPGSPHLGLGSPSMYLLHHGAGSPGGYPRSMEEGEGGEAGAGRLPGLSQGMGGPTLHGGAGGVGGMFPPGPPPPPGAALGAGSYAPPPGGYGGQQCSHPGCRDCNPVPLSAHHAMLLQSSGGYRCGAGAGRPPLPPGHLSPSMHMGGAPHMHMGYPPHLGPMPGGPFALHPHMGPGGALYEPHAMGGGSSPPPQLLGPPPGVGGAGGGPMSERDLAMWGGGPPPFMGAPPGVSPGLGGQRLIHPQSSPGGGAGPQGWPSQGEGRAPGGMGGMGPPPGPPRKGGLGGPPEPVTHLHLLQGGEGGPGRAGPGGPARGLMVGEGEMGQSTGVAANLLDKVELGRGGPQLGPGGPNSVTRMLLEGDPADPGVGGGDAGGTGPAGEDLPAHTPLGGMTPPHHRLSNSSGGVGIVVPMGGGVPVGALAAQIVAGGGGHPPAPRHLVRS